jgi:hypothetical protein
MMKTQKAKKRRRKNNDTKFNEFLLGKNHGG